MCTSYWLISSFSPNVAWDLSDEQVDNLGSEDSRTVAERAELEKKLEVLEKGLNDLDAFTTRSGAHKWPADGTQKFSLARKANAFMHWQSNKIWKNYTKLCDPFLSGWMARLSIQIFKIFLVPRFIALLGTVLRWSILASYPMQLPRFWRHEGLTSATLAIFTVAAKRCISSSPGSQLWAQHILLTLVYLQVLGR